MVSRWNVGIAGGGLTCYPAAPAPNTRIFFLKDIFSLFERQIITVRKEFFYSFSSFPQWPPYPRLIQAKARSQVFLLALPHGYRGLKYLDYPMLSSLALQQETGSQVEQLGHKWAPTWNAGTADSRLAHYYTAQVLK